MQEPFTPLLPGVQHIAAEDEAAARAAITDETCGVIVEPIQGEGGVHVISTPFLQLLRRLCDEHKALLILDEVQVRRRARPSNAASGGLIPTGGAMWRARRRAQCGLGRTGKLWGHEWAGIRPDVMTLAKALGNGLPIGAICVSNQVGQGAGPPRPNSSSSAAPRA